MAIVSRLGRLLHEPFGEKGLKIAESREVIELMNNASVGDEPGVVVIGPMDRANRSAQDVLLKNIEEFDDRIIRPVLWALDEADVLPTIRSRCLRRWCPGPDLYDEDVLDRGRAVVDCSLVRDVPGVIEGLKDTDPRQVLEAAARELSFRGIDDRTKHLWERVREALRFKAPTATEALAAFL
jgi:hypothetical protein